jgi:copper(I)-binding protein
MSLPRIATPLFLAAALLSGAAHAQTAAPVAVDGAWARASVPGQKATGAFMRLTAAQATSLVRAESPAAGVTEVHEMKMEGDVMKMRAMPFLDLPAGKTVELKPGGYHIMLLDLKAPLAKDTTVPVKLTFKDAKGVESTQELTLPVATSATWHACHARSRRCCGPRAWPRHCQALKSPWGLG